MNLVAPLERVCWTCKHYGFKPGNPKSGLWVCYFKKQFWFPDSEEKPGERKGCESWEAYRD